MVSLVDDSIAPGGRAAARVLWDEGLNAAGVIDPLTEEFAASALAELELLQAETPGLIREVLEGAQMSAEQLNVESFHGLMEIVQNADDLGASEVRVAVLPSRKTSKLLIAHDGARVQLRDVIAMTLAFLSTKRDDPNAKGRFGIGLKTLGRIGARLTVHCPPYEFAIEGNNVSRAEPAAAIPHFFDPATTDTLLVLDLTEGFDATEFESWLRDLGAGALIFLDTVRRLRMVNVVSGRSIVEHRLTQESDGAISLAGIDRTSRQVILHEPETGTTWRRFELEWPAPARLRRRYKKRQAALPLGLAVPDRPAGGGVLYAGLPVMDAPGLPFSLNAQFDIDVAREGIQHEELNEWCFDRLGDLVAAVALTRLAEAPARAWHTIPLLSDLGQTGDPWIDDQLQRLVDRVQVRVRSSFRVAIDGAERKLSEVAYEDAPLDGLVTQRELEGLAPGHTLLPRRARDGDGRWRDVLAVLGGAQLITVANAVELFDWSDDDLGPHDIKWFIKLARAGVEAGLGQRLWNQRCIVTAAGERIVPPLPHHEGELLLRHADGESLAARLGFAHVISPAYLTRAADAVVVREWLDAEGLLRDSADPAATLRALATRHADEPIPVTDDDLRAIRDAFVTLDPDDQEGLGAEVGGAIVVDVQSWVSGKRTSAKARPVDAYLPASIEDRTDGWSKAARTTPGIAWVHGRYDDVLRRAGRRPRRGAPRPLAARSFFGLLGAEVAPRLEPRPDAETRYGDPASPIPGNPLSLSQREALRQLKRAATHLKGDRVSPDLLAVLRSIAKERTQRARRERARALLNTLEREWERLYASDVQARAVWSYGSWHTAGLIPATWLAFAIDEPWLSSEDGARKPPRELAVRTPATEAVFGNDKSRFALELDESEATSPVVRALRVETDPQVSEMVEHIEELRDAGDAPDERVLALRYAAIGSACKKRELLPEDLVGDLTVRRLRARFGVRPQGRGLVYASGQWLPPARVRLGAPIFGARGAFVSERSGAERLWRALRIEHPTVGDCLDVLDEIVRAGAPDEADEQVLVNTLVYLEARLHTATRRERERLSALALWTGSTWMQARPVYVTADPKLGEALAGQLPIWQLPVALGSVQGLAAAAGVTVLTADLFAPVVHESAFAAGATLERQFKASVEVLRDWLTRHDNKLVAQLVPTWEALADAHIAVDPHLQLELRLDNGTTMYSPAQAHVVRDPLTLYTADADALGEDDAGGFAVASLFTDADRDKVALAWSRSWSRAARGERGAVSLAEDDASGQGLDDLFKQAEGTAAPVRRRKATKAPKQDSTSSADPHAPLPARRLKTIEELAGKTVELNEESRNGKRRKSSRRGLHDPGPGRPVGTGGKAPSSAPLAYSEQEKEELALQILQMAINGDQTELRDYRHLRGVGADALDKLRRYFEIKSAYGPLPDDVTLTANEAERAFREGEKFYLAVVAGLEEGYETVVRIFPNPLRNLDLKPTTSVSLTGIRDQKRAITVRFPKAAEADPSDPAAQSK